MKSKQKIGGKIFRLCNYHTDGLGWDACSDGSAGCQIEEARAAVTQPELVPGARKAAKRAMRVAEFIDKVTCALDVRRMRKNSRNSLVGILRRQADALESFPTAIKDKRNAQLISEMMRVHDVQSRSRKTRSRWAFMLRKLADALEEERRR